jgi:hypothetical protein
MSTAKVAITIERDLLVRLDRPVKSRRLPNRSRAAQECEKLDRAPAQAMAKEGMSDEAAEWPEY